jgi:hypothetical protein
VAPRYEIRPLGQWIGPVTPDRKSSAVFRAKWADTLDLLGYETEQLGARLVVVQIDVTAGDLRRDGMLRANARADFPGVRVSFDSQHGPLTYATDEYESRYSGDPPSWQTNVRAVALALQALRAVDRYGVSRSGQQYRGWTAIATNSGEFDMTREQAAQLLAADTIYLPERILADPKAALSAYRSAIRKHHPDVGGDIELTRRLTAARDLLAANGKSEEG